MPAGRKAEQAPQAPQDPYLTIYAASRRLGITRQSIYRLGLEGELTIERSAGRMVVVVSTIEAYEQRHPKKGRREVAAK